MAKRKTIILKVVYDVICVALIAVPTLVYHLTVTKSKLGFFCNDDSIKYPYKKDSISANTLLAVCVVVGLAICLATETFLCIKSGTKGGSSRFFHIISTFYSSFGFFFAGAVFSQFMTDVGKQTFGRLRPHFLDVCVPSVQCTSSNYHQYIGPDEYNCTATSHPAIPDADFEDELEDSRLSCPSGHASFSWYCMLYIVLYLEFRLRGCGLRFFRHAVQVGACVFAMWVCASRVIDFKHRYSDIIAGGIVGSFVAVLTVYAYVSSVRRSPVYSKLEASTKNGTQSYENQTTIQMD